MTFRSKLFGAGANHSLRFRQVEWLMGLLDEDLLDYAEDKALRERSVAEEGRESGTRGNQSPELTPRAER